MISVHKTFAGLNRLYVISSQIFLPKRKEVESFQPLEIAEVPHTGYRYSNNFLKLLLLGNVTDEVGLPSLHAVFFKLRANGIPEYSFCNS